MDYVKYWTERTELPAWQLVLWLGITLSKFHSWKRRHGKINAHNGQVPRDDWLQEWDREAIVAYHDKHLPAAQVKCTKLGDFRPDKMKRLSILQKLASYPATFGYKPKPRPRLCPFSSTVQIKWALGHLM